MVVALIFQSLSNFSLLLRRQNDSGILETSVVVTMSPKSCEDILKVIFPLWQECLPKVLSEK